ncbi:MAG: prepilin-type N-terminal cleavage/methylation domain-containing protein [Phycisphaerales bacterium]|nr:prepilin-type N-terminal cleavage/methylation domain-containing protein [Phycisphaerales bacterium]
MHTSHWQNVVRRRRSPGFTLIELVVVIAILALLISILLPSLSRAREGAKTTTCLAHQRQIGMAARMYMDDHNGSMFHHHEGWVLDDGTQVEQLPETEQGCEGGGSGNSQAEKPWVIFFQPYLGNRDVGFCPSDPTERSAKLADNLLDFNGGIERTDEDPPPDSELALAESRRLTITSYLLDSVFTHRSARYAVEGALHGFAIDSRLINLNPDMVMFSERNSEAMNADDNGEYGSIGQDDYDTWTGEAALVRWGEGAYSDQGWIRYNRHRGRANYIHLDGHGATASWSNIRREQYPDRRVRRPLENPPN